MEAEEGLGEHLAEDAEAAHSEAAGAEDLPAEADNTMTVLRQVSYPLACFFMLARMRWCSSRHWCHKSLTSTRLFTLRR